MTFQPLRDYTGFNHVLQAGGVWFHPGNGTAYACACEQRSGVHQDLAVYRLRAGANVWEEVKRYQGTVDSQAQITWGSAAIGMGGALFVVTSLVIPGAPKVTGTGFQGCWIREPNIDAPWSMAAADPALAAAVAQLQQTVAAQQAQIQQIEMALGNITAEWLSTGDRAVLDWAAQVKAAIRLA